jgi:hypothetical protein
MYTVIWSDEALDDFERLHVRHQRVMRVALEELRHQPTSPPTLRRRPLKEPIDELFCRDLGRGAVRAPSSWHAASGQLIPDVTDFPHLARQR